MTLDPLPAIAMKLACALHNMPCRCVKAGEWPWREPKQCQRCEALDLYAAFTAIVQVPVVPVVPGREALRQWPDAAGELNDP